MIELCKGNLLETKVDALVNTVNTEGIMGQGVALQFKKAFPKMFKAYQKACKNGEIQIGRIHLFDTKSLIKPRYIINFPTKRHWRKASDLEYIRSGLKSLIQEVRTRDIKSIALPPLGCGTGKLDWKDVYPLITEAFSQLPDVKVFVFPPQPGFKTEYKVIRTDKPEMNLSRAIVLNILWQYCILGYELTLLEIHKLLYFMQEAGEPLKLKFIKHEYGPYAENLRFVLAKFEGHFIRGFTSSSNRPDTPINLIPEAVATAKELIQKLNPENSESAEKVRLVTELIEGFESPYGMELLATVHWLYKHEQVKDSNAIVLETHAWNERKKKMMKPEHIRIAWDRLKDKGWIN